MLETSTELVHHVFKASNLYCCLDLSCVISLLSGKSTDIYVQLFSKLECHAERLNLKFEPWHVMSDFEVPVIKAVKQKVSVFQIYD